MTRLGTRLRRFLGKEDGSATVEFVIIFPIFMFLFASCFELGTVMLRQTMLDRGIDMTVRQVRLGAVDPVTHDVLKDMICERAAILPNCNTELKLEMRSTDPRAWAAMPALADCIDQADYNLPVRNFEAGQPNQMMILRACHLFEPYFPTFGMGEFIPRQSGDSYALISTSSYVVEPN
jgi:hypothetical protein